MLFLGMGITWAGYAVMSYGYVLIKGWNITFREWVSPLNTYQWPPSGANPPTIPQGRVWPKPGPSQSQGGPTKNQQLQDDVTPGAA
jgi:hypothetical protein